MPPEHRVFFVQTDSSMESPEREGQPPGMALEQRERGGKEQAVDQQRVDEDTSDGMPPLRNTNGRTDHRGVLKLDVPLKGTHATPPLPWQRRYRHVDGFILPWTRAGKLRSGLRFVVTERGSCGFGSEHRVPQSAIRNPLRRQSHGRNHRSCFPQRRNFRAGDVAACDAPATPASSAG